MTSSKITVGIVGFGFMGQTHLAAYNQAHNNRALDHGGPVQVSAICDRRFTTNSDTPRSGNIETGSTAIDWQHITRVTDPADLFADPGVQLVSICTPTDSHVELAIQALDAGKHVLVEKPVALTSEQAARLANHAATSTQICMPAMCMRFWPAWRWLRERIVDRSYGEVRTAIFRRIGGVPDWSPEFYEDPERSGSALLDLHIHDVDFIHWVFGSPAELTSTGSPEHVTTTYMYASGPAQVVAEGGWDRTPGVPFRMHFRVEFEDATAEFELGRNPELMVDRAGTKEPIDLRDETGYDGEVRHVLSVIRGECEPIATIAETCQVLRIIEAERKSLELGKAIPLATE